ncbi:molybdopterin-dependent oxidoreductase [Nonomuraea roseoviolacea]|uniref:DMSO/TMAO reductase YedYZ molybdopterin-dependent catalytic subunit n=1 Tax=Nonomuraea roseoviolacea subsp. carminata TaxID=160689 RepID=A0ABT1JV89_9ACTN|nr:molybdopterin-dependent oxidoreductase [Nonomuraea roseoviolacea]MCP2345327.1 DMSO/TMAO reductase YedYZ molybdopterin-dependent catalytic subunit [Nonomuraea roseoviolacea subsp. carminata]
MQRTYRAPAWAGALAGLTAGAVALGIAQLAAGIFGPRTFPVVAVGDVVVDLTPAPVKDFAINAFGANDKTVLVGGVLVVLALIAAGLGVAALRRPVYGDAGLVAFGVVGVLAVLTRPGAGVVGVVPTVAGVAAGMWTLRALVRRAGLAFGEPAAYEGADAPYEGADADADRTVAGGSAAEGEPGTPVGTGTGTVSGTGGEPEPEAMRPVVMRPGAYGAGGFDRRRLLTGVAGGVVVAGAATVLGRTLGSRQAVDTARGGLALPAPATPAAPLPAGTDFRIGGLSPFVTRNRDFYRVDTALVVPQVDPRAWRLRVHGMVDRPIELTFDDLLGRPLTEADITLTCVSNPVGGEYIGNARWLGVRMADVLREAGLQSGADMLLSTSEDGFTCGTPVDVVMDGRDALFAVAMNGEVLPVDHGFPVRQVVPGLYGYVSATKWVVDVKVTRFDRDEAYWTPRGWAAKAPIKTQSRIDLPRQGAALRAGRTTVAGVAWAQHTGIEAVEVRVDRGEWRRARLAAVPGPDTWRQWALDWDAVPGRHTIEVRATDAAGRTQAEQQAPPAPDGATGWHTITVQVA